MTGIETPDGCPRKAEAHRAREILIVDPMVEDADVLLHGLRDGVEVFCLAPTGGGLEQIAGFLAGRRDVAALHVLCHGEPGALRLAGERVDLPALAMRPAVLSDIAAGLARDATVALYACWVAAGPQGRQFVEYFEAVLGVYVATSTGPVGSAARGGGWTLSGRGVATLEPAFGPAARAAYPGLLAGGPTDGNDSLGGTVGDDTISGLAGNDTISALDGNDVLSGGAGNDELDGGSGDDWLRGHDGLDTLSGGAGNDQLYGYTGDDLLLGGGGNDGLNGHGGDDRLDGGQGDDTLQGHDGENTLTGGDGIDQFTGTAGDLNGDTITDLAPGESIVLGSDGGPGGFELTTANVRFTDTGLEIDIDATDFASPEITINTVTALGGTLSIASVTSDMFDGTTITFGSTNTAPAFTGLDGTPGFTEGGSAVTLDADVTVADTELDALNGGNGDYEGATLTIARNGGANAADSFSFDTTGAQFIVSDGNLQSGGQTFATFTNDGGTLTVNFESTGTTATSALVDNVLQHVRYQNTSVTADGAAMLDWTFSDGTTSSTGSNQVAVSLSNVTAASSNAGGFNTTTGANLSPGVVFDSADETLTVTDASHIAGSTAAGGAGTDTLSVVTGSDLTGFAGLSNFENLTLVDDASVTMSVAQHDAFSSGITAAGTEQITLSATGGDVSTTGSANVETYALGEPGISFTLGAAGQSVTGSNGADTVDVASFTPTGTLNGGGGTDTIVLADGSDLTTTGFTLSNFEVLTLAAGASVTMSESQYEAFTAINGTPGTETITLASADGDGNVTGKALIDTYVLNDAFTFTLATGAGTQSVTGSSGADTVNVSTATTLTGTLDGGGGTDTLVMGDGADINTATVSNFENLTLADNASATIAASQHAQFTGTITAGAGVTVTVGGNGNFTTLANVQTYSVGDDTTDARTITLGDAGTSVKSLSDDDALTFDLGALTYSGTITGESTVADTLSLGNGANIAGGTIAGVENLTLADDALVTMTAAQLAGFTGTVTAAGAETVTLTSTGTIAGASLGNIETLATANDTSAQTVTLSAAEASGKTLTAGDIGTDGFVVTGSIGDQAVTGSAGADTLDGGAGADSLTGGAGNDVFTGSAGDFNGDTISDFALGDSIVVTGAKLSDLNGTAAGGTIAVDIGQNLTLTGISSASGTFAASYDGTDTTIALVAPAPPPPPPSGGGSGSLIVDDGAPGDDTGGSRTITNNGSSSGSAAIVQNTGNNGNLVTATLPPSVSITSSGPSTAQAGDDAVQTLVNAIDLRGPTGEAGLIGNAQNFLNTLASTTTLDIRTIVPTTSSASLSEPITITGSSGGSQSEAFVIDVRGLPSGTTLQLDNIEFASIIGNATVTGGTGDNYAIGDDSAQFISLGEGDDTLFGGDGADTVGSAGGNDLLYGGGGTDTVLGGTGGDTLWGGTESDLVYGNQNGDVLYGNQSDDTLFGGRDSDTVYGGQDADIAYGNLADDVLYGNLGADTLYGGQSNDALYGGQNDDVLFGGIGDDTLHGNRGTDWLFTGDGADIVVVQEAGGVDVVADFDGAAGDRVRIGANLNGTAIDSFAELVRAAADNPDGHAEITLGAGNVVRLMGVSTAELQTDWFVFG